MTDRPPERRGKSFRFDPDDELVKGFGELRAEVAKVEAAKKERKRQRRRR